MAVFSRSLARSLFIIYIYRYLYVNGENRSALEAIFFPRSIGRKELSEATTCVAQVRLPHGKRLSHDDDGDDDDDGEEAADDDHDHEVRWSYFKTVLKRQRKNLLQFIDRQTSRKEKSI